MHLPDVVSAQHAQIPILQRVLSFRKPPPSWRVSPAGLWKTPGGVSRAPGGCLTSHTRRHIFASDWLCLVTPVSSVAAAVPSKLKGRIRIQIWSPGNLWKTPGGVSQTIGVLSHKPHLAADLHTDLLCFVACASSVAAALHSKPQVRIRIEV